MDSALNPYVSLELPDSGLPDVWDQGSDQVSVDVLLPNGYFLSMSVRRDITLLELKEEVWESSRHLPLFRLLRDVDAYVFQCVNLGTAERDELKDETKRLDETRPFQAVLRLRERGEEEEVEAGKQLDGRIGSVLGIGLKLFDKQTDPEVGDFRRQMRSWCESVVSVCGDSGTWESRVLRQHPVSVDASSPSLPPYLQSKLHEGEMVVAISVPQLASESTFKFSVSPDLTARELLELVLRKKGPSLGLQDALSSSLLLKMCGLEEYLIGPHTLAQYKYIQDNLSCDKIPELVLVSSDTIQLEGGGGGGVGSKECPLPRSPDTTSLKRKNKQTISSWSVDEPFRVTLHSVHRLNHDNKTKVCVQCALFHGDDMLGDGMRHTSECTLEEGCCTWEEEWQFDVRVADIPRAAKLCICVYEASTTQKTSRFRKCQDKYACPVAWVNTTVFDYKGELRPCTQTLSTWPYAQEGDEYSSVMVRPLGWLTPNPCHEPAGVVTLSFGRYHQTAQVLYPTMEEIVNYTSQERNDRDGSFSHSGVPQASKLHIQQLQHICERDALYQLHEQEKELMWFLRKHCCEQLPSSLPKLLRCVKWSDRAEVAEMMRLLQMWPPLSPYKALELLDYAYPDPIVRSFAVRCLRGLPDLSLYMLQLVQALKHECYLNNALAKFLLERALLNRHHGHRFFWLLRSEIHFPEVCVRFGLMLEAYCRSVPHHLDALEKQVRAISQLKIANNLVQNKGNIKKEGKEKLKSHIQDFLGKTLYQTIFHGLQNPLDPRFKFGKIRVEKCKFLDSKMKPLWLAFENTDAHGKDVFLIFKNGDDLRQDMLTLQMIRIMDRLWKDEGLDLRLIPYQCMATGHRVGLIEVVPDADTIANIQKEKGFTATSAFKKGSILAWLRDHNPDEISLSKAAEEFTLSCAGYCVATYVLGVADRHSDNIMVKTNGQLFHVDFGHILGKFKEKFGFKRERVPFVLTHDFVYIITKGQTQRSQEFTRFQQHCEKAFMILRRRGPLVISLFAMMLSTGIPELSSERDLDYLRDTLVLDMSEQDALRHFRSKFDEALKNSWKTSVNWAAHNWAKDNKMSDG